MVSLNKHKASFVVTAINLPVPIVTSKAQSPKRDLRRGRQNTQQDWYCKNLSAEGSVLLGKNAVSMGDIISSSTGRSVLQGHYDS